MKRKCIYVSIAGRLSVVTIVTTDEDQYMIESYECQMSEKGPSESIEIMAE